MLTSLGLTTTASAFACAIPKSDKYVGSDETVAAGRRRPPPTSLERSGLHVSRAAEGEAAFYGPKIDFMVRDCIGREWQLGTVQLDYNLPERFEPGIHRRRQHPHRPVMIHRAPFGSMERFMGILIEHFAGAFPLWLAPEQVRVLGLNDDMLDYCQEVQAAVPAGRLPRDHRHRTRANVNKKIRDAQLE